MANMDTCPKCGLTKSVLEFKQDARIKRGYALICKLCHAKYMRERYLVKGNGYTGGYGITLDYYNTMFNEQNGCCKICGRPEDSKRPYDNNPSKLCIDHDHKTGKIRGLLCKQCNLGLGAFDDKTEFLSSAIEYLKGS